MARKREETEGLRKSLLRALQEDCDRPNKDLAHALQVDASTLSRLRERVQHDGLVRAYKAVLDPEKFGLPILAFIQIALIETSRDKVNSVQSLLIARAEIQEIHNIEGDFDMLLKARFKTPGAITGFITETLNKENNIKDTKTQIIMGTIKETMDIPL